MDQENDANINFVKKNASRKLIRWLERQPEPAQSFVCNGKIFEISYKNDRLLLKEILK